MIVFDSPRVEIRVDENVHIIELKKNACMAQPCGTNSILWRVLNTSWNRIHHLHQWFLVQHLEKQAKLSTTRNGKFYISNRN